MLVLKYNKNCLIDVCFYFPLFSFSDFLLIDSWILPCAALSHKFVFFFCCRPGRTRRWVLVGPRSLKLWRRSSSWRRSDRSSSLTLQVSTAASFLFWKNTNYSGILCTGKHLGCGSIWRFIIWSVCFQLSSLPSKRRRRWWGSRDGQDQLLCTRHVWDRRRWQPDI